MGQDNIFSVLNNAFNFAFITECFMQNVNTKKGCSLLKQIQVKALFGTHFNQFIIMDNYAFIFSGEIYNYKKLYACMQENPTTDFSCEIIIHLYKKYGMEYTLQTIEGIFAFILCDYDLLKSHSEIYVARDPFGICPLYILSNNPDNITEYTNMIGFASIIESLQDMEKIGLYDYSITHFQPGTYSKYVLSYNVCSEWKLEKDNIRFHTFGMNNISGLSAHLKKKVDDIKDYIKEDITYYLTNAIVKRISGKNIACILEDANIGSVYMTAILKKYCNKFGIVLETYSMYNDEMSNWNARFLNTNHTSIIVSEEEYTDLTTSSSSSSINHYFIAKYISLHSNAKIVFSSIGYNELMGCNSQNEIENDNQTKELLKNLYLRELLDFEKYMSLHGLEPRIPFLDIAWVQYYLSSIPLLVRTKSSTTLLHQTFPLLHQVGKKHRKNEQMNKSIMNKSIMNKSIMNKSINEQIHK